MTQLVLLLLLLTVLNIKLLELAGIDCGESAVDEAEVKALLPQATVEKALGAAFPYEDDEVRGEESDNALENLRTNPSWAQHLDAAFVDMMIFVV